MLPSSESHLKYPPSYFQYTNPTSTSADPQSTNYNYLTDPMFTKVYLQSQSKLLMQQQQQTGEKSALSAYMPLNLDKSSEPSDQRTNESKPSHGGHAASPMSTRSPDSDQFPLPTETSADNGFRVNLSQLKFQREFLESKLTDQSSPNYPWYPPILPPGFLAMTSQMNESAHMNDSQEYNLPRRPLTVIF